MSKAKTAEEIREDILAHIRHIAHYWASLPDKTAQERCDGVAFSILALIDGHTDSAPAIDLVMRPHPGDKAFHQAEGEDWIKDGTVVNDDCLLHELYARRGT
jgi:hypothetical protein